MPTTVTSRILADALGVSRASVWRWYRAGRIPAAPCVGRTLRFDPYAVAAALAATAKDESA